MRRLNLLTILFILVLLFSTQPVTYSQAQEGQPGGEPAQVEQPGAVTPRVYLPLIKTTGSTTPPPTSTGNLFGYESWTITDNHGASEMKTNGAKFVRRNALLWSSVEPSKGARNWSAVADLENELKNAATLGLSPVLIVRSVPGWAQMYSGRACGPIAAGSLEAFSNFMYDVVARYSKAPFNVLYYEMWNEPDIDGSPPWDQNSAFGCWGNNSDYYFGGQYYGDMLEWAYPKMKQANSNANVLVGGLLADCKPGYCGSNEQTARFLEGILVSGAGNSFDGVGFHAYDGYLGSSSPYYANSNWGSQSDSTGPVLQAKADQFRYLLDLYGLQSKFLANTEVALICGREGVYEPACETTAFENTKAIYLVQAYALAYTRNLRINSWYMYFGWRNSDLKNQDTLIYLPAFYSYQFVGQLWANVNSGKEVYLGSGIKAVELSSGSDKFWVAWSYNDTTRSVNLPAGTTGVWKWNASSSRYEAVSYGSSVSFGFAPVVIKFKQ